MNKCVFSFEGYMLFGPDKGFYCCIARGGVWNVWNNILVFMFIILSLVTQCYKNLDWDETFTKSIMKYGVTNPVNDWLTKWTKVLLCTKLSDIASQMKIRKTAMRKPTC